MLITKSLVSCSIFHLLHNLPSLPVFAQDSSVSVSGLRLLSTFAGVLLLASPIAEHISHAIHETLLRYEDLSLVSTDTGPWRLLQVNGDGNSG